jgi:hypothetical protein
MSEDARPPATAAASDRPSSQLLARAEQAHREGRFAATRALLRELKQQPAPLTPEEQDRAAALAARFRPDPLAAILLITCLLLFALVVARYWN